MSMFQMSDREKASTWDLTKTKDCFRVVFELDLELDLEMQPIP